MSLAGVGGGGVQPKVSSAAGPAPATGTTQAGASNSALMQTREKRGAYRLVPRRPALFSVL